MVYFVEFLLMNTYEEIEICQGNTFFMNIIINNEIEFDAIDFIAQVSLGNMNNEFSFKYNISFTTNNSFVKKLAIFGQQFSMKFGIRNLILCKINSYIENNYKLICYN